MFKRGQMQDLWMLSAIAVFAVILGFLSFALVHAFNNAIILTPNVPAAALSISAGNEARFPTIIDKVFLMLMIVLPIVSIIGAYTIDSNPLFLIISLVLMGFMLFFNLVFGNIYSSFVSNGEFAAFVTEFPIINFMMSHMIDYLIAVGVLVSLALFAKPQRGPA